jgi:hypothetical protein
MDAEIAIAVGNRDAKAPDARKAHEKPSETAILGLVWQKFNERRAHAAHKRKF